MAKPATFEIRRAKDGWRWRLVAVNGRIVAESGEAFTRKPNAIHLSARLVNQFYDAEIKVACDER